jgi:pimeloyl-ACP methyl ester carboxylesterase
MPFASAAGHQLEYEFVLPDRANAGTIVFLHEGLGSIALWRDFPQRLCEAVRRRGLVYSRYGYGKSDPLTDWKNAPRRVDFMHDEATHALPELLDRLAAGAINTRVELVKLANCRHSPHRDQPDAVIRAVQRFLAVAPGSGTTEADSIRPESGR